MRMAYPWSLVAPWGGGSWEVGLAGRRVHLQGRGRGKGAGLKRPLLRAGSLSVYPLRKVDLHGALAVCDRAFGRATGALVEVSLLKYLSMRRVQDRIGGHQSGRKLRYVAVKEGTRLVGMTGLYSVPYESTFSRWRVPGDGVILRVGWSAFVEPPLERGRGYGREFIEVVEKLARLEGAERISIETSEHHALAMALYQKAGFARGWSGIQDYYGPGRSLYTAYKATGPGGRPAESGLRIVALSREEMIVRKHELRRISAEADRVLGMFADASRTPRRNRTVILRPMALVDARGRMRGFVDVNEALWICRETVFSRFVCAESDDALASMVQGLHALLASEGVGLHVVHTSDKGMLDRLVALNGFTEARGGIPDLYGKRVPFAGEFFVKAIPESRLRGQDQSSRARTGRGTSTSAGSP